MDLNHLRTDCAIRQKKGVHFIISSIIIWIAVFLIHSSNLPIVKKNFITFCATTPLLPLSFVIAKLLKIDFFNNSNQYKVLSKRNNEKNDLSELGLLFSLNQILYLIIAMWVYNKMPSYLVMVLAIIFGAHLLPYSWLYKSHSYMFFSVLIPLVSCIVGLIYSPETVALVMIFIEIIFTIMLILENKRLIRNKNNFNL